MTKKLTLTAIWWVSGIVMISLVVYLGSLENVFGSHGDAAIDWLLPHLIPTMTLTGAAAYAHKDKQGPDEAEPGNAPFILACVASLFYLALLAFLLTTSLTATTESANGVIDALLDKNKILGVFQGLAASAIGVFFVKR